MGMTTDHVCCAASFHVNATANDYADLASASGESSPLPESASGERSTCVASASGENLIHGNRNGCVGDLTAHRWNWGPARGPASARDPPNLQVARH